MVWLAAARTSCVPSGADFATEPVPTVPPAPGRFSTITLRPSAVPSSALIERARMSCTPPGAKGTTMRITLDCAAADAVAETAASPSNNPSNLFKNLSLVGGLKGEAAALAAGGRALAGLRAEAEAVVVRGLGGLAHVLFGDGLALEGVAVLAFHVRPLLIEGRNVTSSGVGRLFARGKLLYGLGLDDAEALG